MTILVRYSKTVLLTCLLFILYFGTRLYNISSLPLFTDEAIYTRWAQIARYDANWRFISLTDGKQPSFVWFDMITMRFVEDPLLAGRLVSVLSGFLGLIGIYILAREIFKNEKTAWVAAILYIIYPFSLVYDRMALYDSLVATGTIWALYFEVLLVRLRRLDVALILGMVLGFGVLTKTSAFFSIYLLPFSVLLFDFKQKRWIKELLKWAGLALLSTAMAYGFYSILRLSPFFHIIGEKNSIFVYPYHEWIRHPFEFFFGNLNGQVDWVVTYATIPVVLLILVSFFLGGNKHFREKILLFLWFILPFVALALFGKVLYPRFILFMTMPLLALVAFSLSFTLDKIRNSLVKVAIFLALTLLMIRSDFFILTDFASAPIANHDLDQFMNEWPAGGGISEVVKLLEERAKNEKIYVVTGGTFGSLPTYAMEIYLDENKNIEKRGIFPVPVNIPQDLLERAKSMPVFVFMSNQQEFDQNIQSWPVKLTVEYKKGKGDAYTRLYEVIPNR